MEHVLTRCGFRCDLCLAYEPNITRHPENRKTLSDGWFTYFGFRTPPEAISCPGCRSDKPVLDAQCPVRPCALSRGHETCASCEQYVCDKLRQRIVSREEVRARIGREIPEDDYRRFIEPYENKPRLDALRGGRT